MNLLFQIVLRLAAVALLCLVPALFWILGDITERLRFEAQTSAERVVQRWKARPGLTSVKPPAMALLWMPESETVVTPVVSGVCVDLDSPYDGHERRCGGWASTRKAIAVSWA